MKKILICLTIFFSIFLFNNQVNAEEITQLCEYTNPCLTTEKVEEILTNNGLNYYKDYIVTVGEYLDTRNIINIIGLYEDDINNNEIYYIEDTGGKKLYFSANKLYKYTYLSYLDSVDIFSDNSAFFKNTIQQRYSGNVFLGRDGNDEDTDASFYAYYSTIDIKDENGIVQLKSGIQGNEPIEPEDTRNIITILADTLNGFITNLNENGITFSEILVGLFIFNFVVYVITYMVRHFE